MKESQLKDAEGIFSLDDCIFHIIFCGFDSGNTTTFIHRELQI